MEYLTRLGISVKRDCDPDESIYAIPTPRNLLARFLAQVSEKTGHDNAYTPGGGSVEKLTLELNVALQVVRMAAASLPIPDRERDGKGRLEKERDLFAMEPYTSTLDSNGQPMRSLSGPSSSSSSSPWSRQPARSMSMYNGIKEEPDYDEGVTRKYQGGGPSSRFQRMGLYH
jgi:hypothetical protein